MRGILDELRSAFRGFLKSPLFTVVAIASLALGIGANAAIFSLLDQVLLRSLPIRNPQELIQISQKGSHYGNNRGSRMNSYPLYRDYRDQSTVLSGVLCRREIDMNIVVGTSNERVSGEMVSGNFYEVLGVSAAAGRVLSQSDDLQPGGHPVAVLSHDYWKSRHNADPNVIGQSIRINNFPFTIIGVSAAGFTGLDPTTSPAIRVPVMMKPQMTTAWNDLDNRRSRWVQIFARLKPGITEDQARSALQIQFHSIREEEVKEAAFKNATPFSKEEFLRGLVVVVRAANGYSELRQTFSQPLQILMGIVGMVLLIACSNVANLLVARASGRRREMAVRAALGASGWRLARPLLIESLLLSAIGGISGLILAYGLDALLISFLPSGDNPLLVDPKPDWRIFAFTFGVAAFTGLLFGLIPALTAARADAARALKEEGRGMSSNSGLMRKTLVGVQIALSVMLLIAAGLFVRSLENLRMVDTGLNISRLVQFSVDPSLNGYTAQRISTLERELVARFQSMPGVESAAISSVAKMHGFEWDSSVTIEGHQSKQGENIGPYMDAVSPGYVTSMGMRILEGRDLRDNDSENTALINKKFSDKYFGGRPLGRHVGFGGDPGTSTPIEIVGVFSDARYENLRDEVPIQMLIPVYTGKRASSFVVYVRARGDESALFSQERGLVRQLDPALSIYEMRSFSEQVDQILSTERMVSFLASAFGLIATILASIGLYGVLSLAVARRLKEIGIRIALGAEAGSVIRLVLGEIALLILGGILVGVPAAMLLSRYIESQLYGLKATDPLTLIFAVTLILAIALIAAWIPARRATQVNPLDVLRYE